MARKVSKVHIMKGLAKKMWIHSNVYGQTLQDFKQGKEIQFATWLQSDEWTRGTRRERG